MKAVILVCALTALVAVSCTKAEPKKAPEPEARPVQALPIASTENDMGESTHARRDSGSVMSGKASIEHEAENGAAGQGKVIIVLNDDDEAGGTLTIAGSTFELLGEKQGDNLRLWAVSRGDSHGEIKRGYLIGNARGDGFEGTFAFSGSGGSPRFRGAWSASK
jgi:hypothetical protein